MSYAENWIFRNFLMKFDPAEVNENTMEQDFFHLQ